MKTLLILLALCGSAFADTSFVVRIRVDDGNGVNSLGSGTLVESDGRLGLVLTANHVVRDARSVTVEFDDGSRNGARIVARNPTDDLAALVIQKPPARPAVLADDEPQAGEPLSIGGYGATNNYRQVGGRLGGAWRNSAGSAVWCSVSGAIARQGDSGGPVFDNRGRFAGVVWGQDGEGTMFVRLTCLRRFFAVIPVQWRVCPNGQCYPQQQALVPVVRPQQPPAISTPPVAQPPATQPPVAVTPAEPAGKPCECDNDQLVALIVAMESRQTKLETLIAELASRPPAAGPAGSVGPKGDIGPPGPAGTAATVDVEKIADAVEARIKGSLRVVMEPITSP